MGSCMAAYWMLIMVTIVSVTGKPVNTYVILIKMSIWSFKINFLLTIQPACKLLEWEHKNGSRISELQNWKRCWPCKSMEHITFFVLNQEMGKAHIFLLTGLSILIKCMSKHNIQLGRRSWIQLRLRRRIQLLLPQRKYATTIHSHGLVFSVFCCQ